MILHETIDKPKGPVNIIQRVKIGHSFYSRYQICSILSF